MHDTQFKVKKATVSYLRKKYAAGEFYGEYTKNAIAPANRLVQI